MGKEWEVLNEYMGPPSHVNCVSANDLQLFIM